MDAPTIRHISATFVQVIDADNYILKGFAGKDAGAQAQQYIDEVVARRADTSPGEEPEGLGE